MPTETKSRRKQSERSDETRRKLTEATFQCIARDGYAATSITRIVDEAGLSRGAHIHHFSTKEQLIRATCKLVYASMYRNVGRIMAGTLDGEDRVRQLVRGFWEEVFEATEGRFLTELLVSARADPVVAEFIKPSLQRISDDFDIASNHYFEARDAKDTAAAIIQKAIWEMWGVQLRSIIVRNPSEITEHIETLILRLDTQLKPRTDIEPLPNLPSEA